MPWAVRGAAVCVGAGDVAVGAVDDVLVVAVPVPAGALWSAVGCALLVALVLVVAEAVGEAASVEPGASEAGPASVLVAAPVVVAATVAVALLVVSVGSAAKAPVVPVARIA